MEKLLIVGAGGMGKEVVDLVLAVDQFEIAGFLDDDPNKKNTLVNQIPVLSDLDQMDKYRAIKHLVIAVANPGVKKRIAAIAEKAGFQFPNLIHPSVVFGSGVSLGQGNIICAGSIVSTEVCLQNFITINPQCGIGHESNLHSFSTLYWGVHLGGNAIIGEGCELGTHSCVLQGLKLTDNTILGAGAVAVKSIEQPGTYVGIPARIMNT
ncbi:MAG: acetyltransferase [Thermoclostridium sp.]|nr:acetyltransferase [Thermoclostridium sp.]